VSLLIDIGNSAVKWAVLGADGSTSDVGRQLHRQVPDLTTPLARAWQKLGTRSVFGCSVASGDVVDAVERAVQLAGLGNVQWFGSQPRFDGPPTLISDYRDPLQLGADRWHAMLGALVRVTAPALVVVHAGTATTVDCVSSDGAARFIGGCIAPGVRLMLEALASGTAALPHADGPAAAFPADTDSAIVTGVFDAQAGLVERIWRRFAAITGTTPHLVVGGGHAAALAACLPELAPTVEHNLVLRGLAVRALST
jgi:type III pantothenate kinase